MKRGIDDIGYEIINQILISEVCFDICKSIPVIDGPKKNFLPFYYNLNFSKAIISLHSLLASTLPNELSIKNYLKQYKEDFPDKKLDAFEAEIASISKLFEETLPISLRHKVCAHIDQGFKHSDFTCAYILPESLENYIAIVQNLKKTFLKFCNHSQTDYPFGEIVEQSKLAIKLVTSNN